jgi:hypothetical protein
MKDCTGQLMVKDSPEKLEKHYQFSLKAVTRNYNGYIKSGVVKGKYWSAGKEDKNVCEVCRENENIGVIPLKAKFPSGHLHPPAGKLCRCDLQPELED